MGGRAECCVFRPVTFVFSNSKYEWYVYFGKVTKSETFFPAKTTVSSKNMKKFNFAPGINMMTSTMD